MRALHFDVSISDCMRQDPASYLQIVLVLSVLFFSVAVTKTAAASEITAVFIVYWRVRAIQCLDWFATK